MLTFLIVVMVSEVYKFVKTYKIEHFNWIAYCMSVTSQLTCYKIIIENSLINCSLLLCSLYTLEKLKFCILIS